MLTTGRSHVFNVIYLIVAFFRLEGGAIIQNITAVHVALHPSSQVSVSTQVSALRSLLSGGGSGDLAKWFQRVLEVMYLNGIICSCLTLIRAIFLWWQKLRARISLLIL